MAQSILNTDSSMVKHIAILLLVVGRACSLRVLYPKHPLYPKQADDPYQSEFLAIQQAGVECSLFDFDRLVNEGTFRPRPKVVLGDTILYRGWMMTPAKYEEMISHLETLGGAKPITSVSDYRLCHHLPGWYQTLADLTSETVFVSPNDDIQAAATELGWDSFFVKDFVKSNTSTKGSIAQSPKEVLAIVNELKLYRGDVIEGGISLRKVENFVKDSEQRYFVINQKCYSPLGDVPVIVETVAERVEAPFFSVDIAQTQDGQWRVIELGDGQVSDKKEWPLDKFVELLLTLV